VDREDVDPDDVDPEDEEAEPPAPGNSLQIMPVGALAAEAELAPLAAVLVVVETAGPAISPGAAQPGGMNILTAAFTRVIESKTAPDAE
jgi:hypothetical protein